MGVIDRKLLAANNTRDSCWIAISGIVWDVTDFIDQHPGGAKLILKNAGKDASEEYDLYHNPELVEETLGSQAKRGSIDMASDPGPDQKARKREQGRGPPLSSMINLNDFERHAEKQMTPTAWAYVSSGADDEISVRDSANAYQKVFLRGRILKAVGRINCSTTILGCSSALPIYTSPVGLAKLVHPSGECAIAAAAGKEGVIQVVNTVSSMPIEAIMAARISNSQPVFWQLYVDKDLKKSKAFVERVEKAGVKSIWLTVDSPVTGNRERDERAKTDTDVEENFEDVVENTQSVGIAASNTGFINANIDWSIIRWLREVTSLPIVIKGIQSTEDAKTAYEYGVDGIVISCHGGRSLDGAQPPLLTLLEINRYAPQILGGKMQIFIDGGVRRGTDVIKALALGATAVGIGRPVLNSMAGGYGEYGVRRMIQILKKEIQTNMAYLGAKNVKELDRTMLNTRRLENLIGTSAKL